MEEKIRRIILSYGSEEGFLVPILQDIQKELNYLPQKALHTVSAFLNIPISRIYEVATFYKAFSLTPRGRHQLSLCLGTACHVRNAPRIQTHIERVLDLKAGETSADLEFTFETVNCLGACALGPILTVDGAYHGQMTLSKANNILKQLGKKVKTDDQEDEIR
jgi:NADH-quinone oxidoreductase subunit E